MTQTINVAAIQYCARGTATETLDHIRPMIAKAAQTARLITLPEAASFIAASRDELAEQAEWDDASHSQKCLADIAQSHRIWLLAGSLLLRQRSSGKLVNRSLLLGPDGRLVASYDKIHMFDANVGDGTSYQESASFKAGSIPVIAAVDDVPVGMSICYDLRFPHLFRQLAQDGAKIILVPAAFTAVSGQAHWHVLLRARAIETGCFVVAPAQVGLHADGRQTYGHSLIINPWGKIIAEASTNSPNNSGADCDTNYDAIITATLDLDEVSKARQAIPSLATNPNISATRFF